MATQGIVEMGAEQERVNFELGESIAKVADVAILIGINKENIRLGMLSGNFCDRNIYLVEHLDNAIACRAVIIDISFSQEFPP